MSLDGYAFIVGGGDGIGKACAVAFAKEGCLGMVIADINLEAAQDVVASSTGAATAPGFRAEAVFVDVTKEDSVRNAVARMAELFPRIDYCVNSAGIGVEDAHEIADAKSAEFIRFMDVNVTGTFYVTREISKAMKSQSAREIRNKVLVRGSIVNMASAASFAAQPWMVQYTTSKHAVLGLSKNAALDNAGHGIRVNCVCPSWVDTAMVRRAIENVPGLHEMIQKAVPMGRLAQVEEVADATVFLSSDKASFVTGSAFVIDGGTTTTCHV